MSTKYDLKICPVNPSGTDDVNTYYGSYEGGSDSGVDLHCFRDILVPAGARAFTLKLGVKCELSKVSKDGKQEGSAYWMVPRSSISKTPLRLANSIGLIDSEYRGELMAKVDNVSDEHYHIKTGDRLFQLATTSLKPINIVTVVAELSETKRGEGGFGSTGR